MPVVHKPVAQGECLGCHDPHGGSTTQLIREASVVELCNRCHESITRGRSVLHTPVMKGACESCHPPHASRFPKLLDAVGPDLCLACHGDFEARMASVKFTHKALEKGCEKCHDVHGSNHAMATTQPVREQCGGCHEKVMTVAANAKVKHAAMSDERSCMNCHTPHGSALDKLVSDMPAKLCWNCHKQEIKIERGSGGVVAAMPDLWAPQARVHGALREGRCAGCHGPHGSDSADLLTRFYSTRFYQSFEPAAYELCLSCHEPLLATQRETSKVTAFRNGQTNLHFVHVKLQGERGENCRVCHETHAGMGARGVRHRVRFGTWEMPIRFSKTETGGTCFPGCHPLYGYDRARPIDNKVAPHPQPSIARAAQEKPALIELHATDTSGQDVHVPHRDRPSVLLLALGGQEESEQALKRLTSSAPEAQLAQIIVILGGLNATERAKTINLPFPILLDADGRLASELEVHGWPTAVVITSGGAEIARVGGTANSLAMKLAAYLDVASGRVDRITAARRATTRDVVGDRTAENNSWASRELYAAEQLIASGRFDQAKQILPRILAQRYDPARAHYLMGRVLEHEQDWQGAAREYRAMRETRP
jgi:predicted CXXCH cytochrome family protein